MLTNNSSNSNSSNRFLIFLGCAIPYRVSSYEISARKVLAKLEIELVEMPEFNCCGLPLDPVNHEAMLILSAKNLALAEQQELNILTLCPGCAGTFKKVSKILEDNSTLKQQINEHLNKVGLEFKGLTKVKHLLQFLREDVGIDKVKAAVVKPLSGLKVTEHNGCHVLRPKQYIGFDDPEDPQTLKLFIEATGATCLDYVDKTECCGAPSVGVSDKVALSLAKDKLSHVKNVQAQALITICPFCHIMYDTNERRIEKMYNEAYNIPILHYPQLLGLALGLTHEELAFNDLRVNPTKLLNKVAEIFTQ
ncbi:MAG: CoB--CoM heterodisulfide reductase iron-sulfur subunit B family protein [Nitrososphaerota archaeon]|jgi:heterodisulfide reductase subunit B|nr:CoB--CoM heterodisulfide reductase iron-sulfur subunit B family protein [Nitrososphaerota archaeon]